MAEMAFPQPHGPGVGKIALGVTLGLLLFFTLTAFVSCVGCGLMLRPNDRDDRFMAKTNAILDDLKTRGWAMGDRLSGSILSRSAIVGIHYLSFEDGAKGGDGMCKGIGFKISDLLESEMDWTDACKDVQAWREVFNPDADIEALCKMTAQDRKAEVSRIRGRLISDLAAIDKSNP